MSDVDLNKIIVAAAAFLKDLSWEEKRLAYEELSSPLGFMSFVAYLDTLLWTGDENDDLFVFCHDVACRIWSSLDWQQSM